ncbi:MAG: hypothetical protein A2152_02845 [Candidatus Levybacteria bacterium RBG_16_35_6]|nr:MAG: hypothetical protein A2152_02845 [Candidatus Levybacteria bacterium RBG_16_35_6]
MKIIGTGLTGLIGSRLTELLTNYQFQNLSKSTGVDITKKEQVLSALSDSDSNIVIHLAAFTDVDQAEKDKELSLQSMAWKVNVEGTKNVVEACEKNNKKIVYFSTDMVFPGRKELPEKYSEDDETNAVGFYAKTKEQAEKIVEKATCPWIILRLAYPFRANFGKKDYARSFKELLEKGVQIKAVSDHYFTPTFVDDIAKALDLVIKENLTGKLHVTGGETVSPFEVAIKIADLFNLNKDLIGKTTREEFFKNRAPRAYNLSLNNDKMGKLGVRMLPFSEGLLEVKRQLEI